MSIRTKYPAYADLMDLIPSRKPEDVPDENYHCPACGRTPAWPSAPSDFKYDSDLETHLCGSCIFEIWLGHAPSIQWDKKRWEELRTLIAESPDFSKKYAFVKWIEVE